jgi:serine/threonine protein kinase
MTPAALGPYQILRRLGHGGMAQVFLAVAHGASGFARQVAIKTVLPGLAHEPAFERALVHEACMAGRLAHRNLVAILGLGVASDLGQSYVVMEYVDGGDLDVSLAGRALPVELALLVTEELALGLAHLHAATDERGLPLGLVHRDVSPSNVLVSRAGEIKLGDFGIAKATALTDLTGGTRKGKYCYMSPEQLAGEPLTAASDQFSLAVLLVELLTGTRPFEADTPLETMEKVQRGPRPDLSAQPPAVAELVRRALDPDPHRRFASSADLRAAILSARHPLPPVGPPELAAWLWP